MKHEPSNSPLFERLKADLAARRAIIEADVVIGINTEDNSHAVFYGAATLKRIVQNDNEKTMGIVHVPLDWDTNDPEVLAAFCLTYKGSHDWGDTPSVNVQIN